MPPITTTILQELKKNHHPGKCVHANQYVVFAVNNFFLKQHSKVIKPTKRLKSTIKSTVKAAATVHTLVFQKHQLTLGSIAAKEISKILMQYQLANILTGTIMILTISENSLL